MLTNLEILFQAPIFIVDLVINGLLIGAIFVLVAYGMALVWGVMNIINITQGELVMLGGYVTWLVSLTGVNPLFGLPVSAAALFVVGWVMYRIVIFRIVDRDMFVALLATFGLAILLAQLINQVFGANLRVARSGLDTLLLFNNMVTVAGIKLVAFGLALLVGALLWLFLKRSRLGQAIRATSQNSRAAGILGVETDRVYAFTFSINAALCGAAGSLVVMAYTIHPYIGLPYTVRAFLIAITAGIGNVPGVIVAGLGLGVAENFAGFVLGAEFQVAFVFLLMVLILVIRSLRLRRQRRYLR